MHHRFNYETGEIEQTVSGPVLLMDDEGMIPAGNGEDNASHYVLAGAAVERPAAPVVPAEHTLEVGEVWILEMPAETLVYVNGRLQDEPWNGSLQFDTAAEYALRFVPPFPQAEAQCLVTVE